MTKNFIIGALAVSWLIWLTTVIEQRGSIKVLGDQLGEEHQKRIQIEQQFWSFSNSVAHIGDVDQKPGNHLAE